LILQKLIWLSIAGALGTLARFGLSGFINRINGASFLWGTVAVNIIGCLLAGLVWALFEKRWPVSGEFRMIVLIGFMGAFTTFSAVILDTGELLRSAEWMRAVANVLLQNGVGVIALFLGVALGRLA